MGFEPFAVDRKKIRSTEDALAMKLDLEDIAKKSGLELFNYGWDVTQYEQFVALEDEFWKIFGISLVVVFVVSLLLSLSLLGAFLMSFFSAALTLELYGCIAIADLRFQALLATSALMALGMAVEFTAHPIVAYGYAVGTREERVTEAMEKSAMPVMEGAISSFVGFLMLLFSDFPYVRKYFFTIYMLIIGLGCFNGLVLLPSLLGLLGWSSEGERQPGVPPRKSTISGT